MNNTAKSTYFVGGGLTQLEVGPLTGQAGKEKLNNPIAAAAKIFEFFKHRFCGVFCLPTPKISKILSSFLISFILIQLIAGVFWFAFPVNQVQAATLFSDNFDDNSIDASKWIEVEYLTNDNIQETGGKISLNGSGGAWNRTALFSQTNFTRAVNTTFITTVNLNGVQVMYGFKDSDANYSYANMVYGIYFHYISGYKIGIWEDGSGSQLSPELSFSLNTNYRIAIVLKAQGAKYYIQGGAYGTFGSNSWTLIYNSSYSTESNLKAGFTVSYAVTDQTMTMDDVAVYDTDPIPNDYVFQNIMVAKPTTSSVTLLASMSANADTDRTYVASDVVIDYGATTAYGSTTSASINQTTHKILISGLSPDSTYHYRIIANPTEFSSSTTSTSDTTFKTQTSPGNNFTFATISDMQGGNWSSVASQIQTLNPDLIVNVGDNIAGESTTDATTYYARWQTDVFNYSQNLTNHIPSYWTMGNHDYIGPLIATDPAGSYVAFANVLSLPIPVENTLNYYSFDYGDVHFAVINASWNTVSLADRTWLDSDLASTSQKWKVVLMHMPNLNPTGVSNLITTDPTAANALHVILRSRGVQLVINGHSHVYYRWIKDGVYYINNTTAGNVEWPVFNDSTGDAGSLGASISTKGFLVGNVSPSQITISCYDQNGILKDTFNVAPNTFDVSSPSNNVYSSSSMPTFSWDASSQTDVYASPPLALSKYQLYIDGSLNKDNISSSTTSATPTSALSEGPHTWYVKSVNNASQTQQSISTYTVNIAVNAPTIATPTVLSSSAIRWNFTDNSSYETGFRVYTNADAIATSSATANLTYLDEIGLSENTQYAGRYVKAYNSYGESSSSSVAASKYTLADTPTGLALTAQSTTQIDSSVDTFPNHSSGQSGYYFANTTASTNSGWQSGDNTWSETTLSPNTQYTYTVKYRNGDGVETATATTTKYTLSSQVSGFSATNATTKSDYKINLTWTNQGQSGVEIEQDTNCDGYETTPFDSSTTIPTSPYEVSVSANTCYKFRISSYNGDGVLNTTSSPETSQITTPPSQPTGLTNTASATTTITWDWNDVTGATGYKVYRASDDQLLTTIGTAASNWTQDSLNPNTQYSVYIRATNSNGEGIASASASAYTSANSPTNASHSDNTTSSITWTWSPGSYQKDFYAWTNTPSDNSGWTTNTFWQQSSLTANTQYTCQIKARNESLQETSSVSTSVYTSQNTPTGISFDSVGTNSITISASGTLSNIASSSAGLYFLNNAASSTSGWTQTNSWDNSSLSPNTQYTYKIKARNGDGDETSYTATSSKYTLADTPTGLTSTNIASQSITLTVDAFPNAASGLSGYYFSQGNHNSGWIQTNIWQDTNLTCPTSYTYSVKYRNGDGAETSAITTTLTTEGCAGYTPPPQTTNQESASTLQFCSGQACSTQAISTQQAATTTPSVGSGQAATTTPSSATATTTISSASTSTQGTGINIPTITFEKPFSQMTPDEIIAKITQITQAISQVQSILSNTSGNVSTTPSSSNIPAAFSFQTPLSLGMSKIDVKYLQILFNQDPDTQIAQTGAGSPGNETSYFGQKTKRAVIKFQEKYLEPMGFVKGTGFVAKYTIAKLNDLLKR